jgi:hypothetical protein
LNLWILVTDELRGFYRSRVMLFLWLGLPVMVAVLHAFHPSDEELAFTAISGMLVGSLGGTLGSAMLAVSLINEKSAHVYDLFLIRPVARRDLLLAKFLAVFGCIMVAGLLAHGTGLVLDLTTGGMVPSQALADLVGAFWVTLSGLAVSCAVGVAIGVVTRSVLAGVILVIYVGNQVTGLPLLPVLLGLQGNVELLAAAIGVLLAVLLLLGAIALFNRQEL